MDLASISPKKIKLSEMTTLELYDARSRELAILANKTLIKNLKDGGKKVMKKVMDIDEEIIARCPPIPDEDKDEFGRVDGSKYVEKLQDMMARSSQRKKFLLNKEKEVEAVTEEKKLCIEKMSSSSCLAAALSSKVMEHERKLEELKKETTTSFSNVDKIDDGSKNTTTTTSKWRPQGRLQGHYDECLLPAKPLVQSHLQALSLSESISQVKKEGEKELARSKEAESSSVNVKRSVRFQPSNPKSKPKVGEIEDDEEMEDDDDDDIEEEEADGEEGQLSTLLDEVVLCD